MPLSEFLRMARGKLESSHQKPTPNDSSARSENDIVELVWENGQIVMQGQSSRASRSRSPTLNNLSSNTSRVCDSRFGKFGGVESIMNDMAPVVPSGEMDLSQDDEIVPWLSYPIDDALGQDYVSEILPEISGVTANGSFLSVDKRASCEQAAANLKVSSSKNRLFRSWLPHNRQASEALGSGVSHMASNNSSNHLDAVFRHPVQSIDGEAEFTVSGSGSASMMMERPSSSNFLNFSHFSRPANLVKANIPKSDGILKSVSPVKVTGDPLKSMDINSHGSGMVHTANYREPVAKGAQGSCPLEIPENLCPETSSKNGNSAKGAPERKRAVEPMVASSSVGSGNSADRVSFEQTQHSKRKFRNIEESECRSDDLETESIDAKKLTHVRGSKRGRAAEVHNLSERRRRDRINEKMRALQELIPNCNKADKASMLDEAIEYLKTLQLQLQIMSVGSGLYMPQMMFPTGMQHMHPAHVPHFQAMGVGMGFGMGLPDMNVVSSGSPLFPVPPLQHFPSPMSGLAGFQRMPAPNLPVFGPPGQALPNSALRTAYHSSATDINKKPG